MRIRNKQIILKKRPIGMPVESDFDLKESFIEELKDDEVIIKVLWLSLDPYMRGRMSEAKSYANPIKLGEVITGGAVGEIIESKSSKFLIGDIVESFTIGWQEFARTKTSSLRKINKELAPIQTALGVLGMPGMTAYFGLFDVCKPIPGDVIVISAASGAVGQLVGQLAKLAGCYVIGIAGKDSKCSYIKDTLNFDKTINYQKENIYRKLKEYAPSGVNVYFDNVGGKISDDVISNIAPFARIAICGVISQYNLTAPEMGLRVQRAVLTNQATIEGFLVFRYEQKYSLGLQRMSKWVKEKKVIWKEDIVEGLDNAPSAFIGMMEGKNFGKLLIKVS